MEKHYFNAKKLVDNVLGDELNPKISSFVDKCDQVLKRVVKKGSKMNVDLSKILGLVQGLRIVRSRKDTRLKKLVIALIIASLTALALGLTIKSYAKIRKGRTAEEKIKIFIKSLKLDKLKDNPTISKIKNEIKSLMEQ